MNYTDPKVVALLFNEQINLRNLERLTDLMAPDHRFIYTEGERFTVSRRGSPCSWGTEKESQLREIFAIPRIIGSSLYW